MRLQLILLNSFVFLTSFVLPSGKGHFLVTDQRRKDPKFTFASRTAASFLCPGPALLEFSLTHKVQDELRPGLGGKNIYMEV